MNGRARVLASIGLVAYLVTFTAVAFYTLMGIMAIDIFSKSFWTMP